MKQLKSLSDVQGPAQVVFVAVRGECVKKLQDMGLLPGEKFGLIHNANHGPVMISLKGTTVAIGSRLAHKIMVREV
jgi:Fe2+ transport system protein FeoA